MTAYSTWLSSCVRAARSKGGQLFGVRLPPNDLGGRLAVPNRHDTVDLAREQRIMRYDDDRNADLAVQLAEQVENLIGHLRIQRAGRFVGEQQLRLVR